MATYTLSYCIAEIDAILMHWAELYPILIQWTKLYPNQYIAELYPI